MARELTLTGNPQGEELSAGSLVFIGTATCLLRFGGFTVLTDPNFLHRHGRINVGFGLHATRQTDPAMELDDLPPLDLVLLSHLHEDHFDRVAEARLDRDLPIATTPQAARALRRKGFRAALPLSTWEPLRLTKGDSRLTITAAPGKHGPGPVARLLPQVMGSVLDFEAEGRGRLLRLYVSGDTLVHAAVREIPRRFPDVDLALLHLGGTRVLGLLVTMDDRQGIELFRIIDPRLAIPIHYDDYDIFKSPLGDFIRRARAEGLADRMHYLQRGETFAFRLGPKPPAVIQPEPRP